MVLGSTLSTSLGSLQIVIWSSRRPNSDRIIHVWYAPALGFAPMLATHTLGSTLEWIMNIQKFDRPAIH